MYTTYICTCNVNQSVREGKGNNRERMRERDGKIETIWYKRKLNSIYNVHLPCLCHPVPFNATFSSLKWAWLLSNTHCFKSNSNDKLDADRLTFEPTGSGGLCVVMKGLSLCRESTAMVSFGQEAVKKKKKKDLKSAVHFRTTVCITMTSHNKIVEWNSFLIRHPLN